MNANMSRVRRTCAPRDLAPFGTRYVRDLALVHDCDAISSTANSPADDRHQVARGADRPSSSGRPRRSTLGPRRERAVRRARRKKPWATRIRTPSSSDVRLSWQGKMWARSFPGTGSRLARPRRDVGVGLAEVEPLPPRRPVRDRDDPIVGTLGELDREAAARRVYFRSLPATAIFAIANATASSVTE